MLITKGLKMASWFINSIANIHICNNCNFITKFYNKLMQIDDFTLDRISLGQKKVYLHLN